MPELNAYCVKHYDLGLRPSDKFVDLVSRVEIPQHSRIIDVGCGNGRNTLYLASLGSQVHAVDISRNALSELERRAGLPGVKITALENRMDQLDFNNEFFDYGVSWRVFHIGRPEENRAAIGEMRRVLKKGALAFIAVAASYGKTFWERSTRYGFVDKNTIQYQSNGFLHTKHYFSEEELSDYFRGFDIQDKALFEEQSGHSQLMKHVYWALIMRRKHDTKTG